MATSMKEQVVVVVGAGSGIGLAVAKQASELGAQVVAMTRSPESVSRLRDGLPRATVVQMDVMEPSSVERAFAPLERIDHVYAAAGSTRLGSILDGDLQTQLEPLQLRLWGSIYVVRAAAKKVRAGGSFTFTGGLSTDRPVAGAWVSSVATAAAEQLARAMALELAPVRFNAIAPGWTDTPMWDKVLGPNKDEVLRSVAAKQPIGRISTPDEVASAVLFLMGNEAATGETIHIDGGGRLV